MASATCKTVAGVYSAAQPVKLRTSSCMTIAGAEMAAGSVTWGGSQAKRKFVNWLPAPTTPLSTDGGKTMSPVWYRALHELFEHRMGGIDAPTLPQVVTSSSETQTQVLSVQSVVLQSSANLQQVADTVNTVRDVTVQNGLAGSDQIQKLPVYKLDQLGKLDSL